MFSSEDSICAPATVPGSGAISIIRISGPKTMEAVDSVVKFRHGSAMESPGYTMKFGTVEGLDDVMVYLYRNPHSYTGEDAAEISCHASSYIVTNLLERLIDCGLRMAEPGEFTRRAFLNGKLDLAQAEAVADVISSDSEAAHRVAFNQLRGGYSRILRELRDRMLELSALLELELDFSEEDVEFADRSQLTSLLEETLGQVRRLSSSFRDGNAIKNGIPVAIAGATNAGKSTLLNALLGEDRAIVSDIAGTTRDTVEEQFVIDGLHYRLIDTAGLRETDDIVERMGIDRSREAMHKADVVIGVLDACSSASAIEESMKELISAVTPGQTLIFALNKIDAEGAGLGVEIPEKTSFKIVHISAKTGLGLDELRSAISASQKDRFGSAESLVTNLRHYQALCNSAASLEKLQEGLRLGIPTDLLAEDLRSAISSLSSIWGEGLGISAQDTLNLIFQKHCIGK